MNVSFAVGFSNNPPILITVVVPIDKYDVPVGFPPGKLPRQSSRGEVFPGGNPTGRSYLFYYTEQIQNTKGGKLQTPEILDKYLSSAFSVELVSPVTR